MSWSFLISVTSPWAWRVSLLNLPFRKDDRRSSNLSNTLYGCGLRCSKYSLLPRTHSLHSLWRGMISENMEGVGRRMILSHKRALNQGASWSRSLADRLTWQTTDYNLEIIQSLIRIISTMFLTPLDLMRNEEDRNTPIFACLHGCQTGKTGWATKKRRGPCLGFIIRYQPHVA